MTQYDNTNKGVLFTNKNKKQENSPDFTGKVNIGGVDYRLAGWKKTSQMGEGFLSLSVSKIEEQDAPF